MQLVFHSDQFHFPYTHLKFPGQASDEAILYVTREAPVVLWLRMLWVIVIIAIVIGASFFLPTIIQLPFLERASIVMGGLLISGLFSIIAWWWIYQLWRKSVFVLTNRRLTKFIYTTPWNRYHLSLNLDSIVDTGAYARTYFESVMQIGTFTARSSAGNRKDKYFYLENIWRHEDLASYISKLLHANKQGHNLENFRPFIPELKGDSRKIYMEKYPHYWS